MLIVFLFTFFLFRQNREMFTIYESAHWGDGECCKPCNVNYGGYKINAPSLCGGPSCLYYPDEDAL